jgi:hypothetical protein
VRLSGRHAVGVGGDAASPRRLKPAVPQGERRAATPAHFTDVPPSARDRQKGILWGHLLLGRDLMGLDGGCWLPPSLSRSMAKHTGPAVEMHARLTSLPRGKLGERL